jgi:hypothetical protein
MSRYRIPAHEEHYDIHVGWDDPLETYFVQIFTTTTDDDDAGCILWEGHGFQALPTVEAFQRALQPYATLPPAIRTQLCHDRAHTTPRSPLQEQILQRFILQQS